MSDVIGKKITVTDINYKKTAHLMFISNIEHKYTVYIQTFSNSSLTVTFAVLYVVGRSCALLV